MHLIVGAVGEHRRKRAGASPWEACCCSASSPSPSPLLLSSPSCWSPFSQNDLVNFLYAYQLSKPVAKRLGASRSARPFILLALGATARASLIQPGTTSE